jgi:hypothetical protein
VNGTCTRPMRDETLACLWIFAREQTAYPRGAAAVDSRIECLLLPIALRRVSVTLLGIEGALDP